MNALLKKNLLPEWFVLFLYSVLNIILTIFHEPWFDEAESWLIARDASFHDILFVRPHYEGHPPFWHLLLSIPAKAGFPYEPSIKIIQFLFALLTVFLILFCSPFPRPMRLFLPFTYFFLYQYGVIARPYALFCSAIFLTAIFWKDRNEKPWRAILSLLGMCLCTAYGIVLAGGMTLSWVISAFHEEKLTFFSKRRRLAALFFLLFGALFLCILIWPAKDAYALIYKQYYTETGIWFRLLFFWSVIPADTVFTSLSDYACIFEQTNISFADLISAFLISFPVFFLLFFLCRNRKKTLLLFLPYTLLSIVASSSYFNAHHYGIILSFLLSVLWICLDDKRIDIDRIHDFMIGLKKINGLFPASLKAVCALFILSTAIINLWWSSASFIREIEKCYSFGKEASSYIKNNSLSDYRWFEGWNILRDKNNENTVLFEDTDFSNGNALVINPYLEQNLIYNLPLDITYATHQVASPEKVESDIARWKKEEEPDFILSSALDFPYIAKRLSLSDSYRQITISSHCRIWKADPCPEYPFYIYIRSELFDSLEY